MGTGMVPAKAGSPKDIVPTLTKDALRRALTVIEGVATGGRVQDLTGGDDQPKRGTFYRWLTTYPELKRAFDTARELSAYSFEEKALELVDTLIGTNDFTGVKVRMYEVAMAQLRWSASRRNPGALGEKATVNTVIPIQINTSLDLGQIGGGTRIVDDNVYTFAANVEVTDAEAEEPGTPLELEPGLEPSGPSPLLDPELTTRVVPDIPRGQLRGPRRPKGHTKSPAAIKRQITLMEKKNGTVG